MGHGVRGVEEDTLLCELNEGLRGGRGVEVGVLNPNLSWEGGAARCEQSDLNDRQIQE